MRLKCSQPWSFVASWEGLWMVCIHTRTYAHFCIGITCLNPQSQVKTEYVFYSLIWSSLWVSHLPHPPITQHFRKWDFYCLKNGFPKTLFRLWNPALYVCVRIQGETLMGIEFLICHSPLSQRLHPPSTWEERDLSNCSDDVKCISGLSPFEMMLIFAKL